MNSQTLSSSSGRARFSPSLRNPDIDYSYGVFFITLQIHHNKSICGSIFKGRLSLTDLGREVVASWEWLRENRRAAGFHFDEFIVMPNHFHGIIEIEPRGRFRPRTPGAPLRPAGGGARVQEGLPAAIRDLKRHTTRVYKTAAGKGLCPDIGPSLWRRGIYDRTLFKSDPEYEKKRAAAAAYILANPKNWEKDRFGPVTAHMIGNPDLLGLSLVAYVASEGPVSGPVCAAGPGPVISTFTSDQEWEMMKERLATNGLFIWVAPGGIPARLPPAVARALEAGRGLIISPFETGTPMNKAGANWCNAYVLSQAAEIRTGYIRPGGSLETLLKAIRA